MATNHEVGSSILSGRTISLLNPAYRRSLALLGISPAGSRFAHARKTAQVRFSPGAPFYLPKGFSIWTPAIICPAFRSSEKIRLAPHLTADATIRASQNPIRDSSSIRNADEISAGVVSTHQIE